MVNLDAVGSFCFFIHLPCWQISRKFPTVFFKFLWDGSDFFAFSGFLASRGRGVSTFEYFFGVFHGSGGLEGVRAGFQDFK